MSQYSTSVRADYFDPRIDVANRICEFRLNQDTAYAPNLRLVNLGAISSVGDQYYNRSAGAYGVIRHIRLLDGAVELSSCRFANSWLSFVNRNNSNDKNVSVNSSLDLGSLGYFLDCNCQVRPVAGVDTEASAMKQVYDEGVMGHLDLRKCLPILGSLSHLDTTSVFENLRIVIEYETDVKLIGTRDDRTATTQAPVLIADEIINKELVGKLNKAQSVVGWNEVEHDQFAVATGSPAGVATTATNTQNVSAIINAFDGKYVQKMVLIKSHSNTATPFVGNQAKGEGAYGSLAQLRETLQIRKNGANIFAGAGLTKESQKQMLLSHSWGDINLIPFGARQSIGLDTRGTASVNNRGVGAQSDTDKTNTQVGQQSFIGFSVEDRVHQLNLIYKREIPIDTDPVPRNSSPLNIHIFGLVAKNIVFGKGKYNVSYA